MGGETERGCLGKALLKRWHLNRELKEARTMLCRDLRAEHVSGGENSKGKGPEVGIARRPVWLKGVKEGESVRR